VNIGEKIKRLRIKTNLTQEELANRCELSKGFISQLERDLTSPSIATLMDILECLGVSLKDFFGETESERVVFGKNDFFIQENEENGHSICWIIPNAQKNIMEPLLIRLVSGGRSDTYTPHEGEVFGYVTAGGVTLFLGEEQFKIKKGESFYYKANAPYHLVNNGKTPAAVLWVSTPPSF